MTAPDSLDDASCLVVVDDGARGLVWACALARAGARVRVDRRARVPAPAELHGYDGALIAADSPGAASWIAALRVGPSPLLAVVAGQRGQLPALTAAGAHEVVRGHAGAAVVAAMVRTVGATWRMRTVLGGDGRGESEPAPHFRRAVDHAIADLARGRGLSAREQSVLRYVALGYPYAAIGHRLSIAPRTVKMHAANVRRKTGVRTREQLLREVFGR